MNIQITKPMNQYSIKKALLPIGGAISRFRKPAPEDCQDALFIWVPKVAGTSIVNLLTNLGMVKLKSYGKAKYHYQCKGLVAFGHQSPKALQDAGILPADYFNKNFAFAFIREPFSRIESLHRYYRKLGRIDKEMGLNDFLKELIKQWEMNENIPPHQPKDFSARLCYYGEDYSNNEKTLQQVGLYNLYDWSQCRPQKDWLAGIHLNQISLHKMDNLNDAMLVNLSRLFKEGSKLHQQAYTLFKKGFPQLNQTQESEMQHSCDIALQREIEKWYKADYDLYESLS